MSSEPMLPSAPMLPVEQAAGLAFERAQILHGSSFRDASTVVVIPTRGQINYRVVHAWRAMIAPMNQKRYELFAAGDEVGEAYNKTLAAILAHPEFSKCRYVLTLEDDNIVPADAHIRLLESIEEGGFDAVSGIYWTKGPFNMPMAYGDYDEYVRTGEISFAPRDVRAALARGQIMPCLGIAMGCALWRMDLFRELEPPWYVSVADVLSEERAKVLHGEPGGQAWTQDLWFCRRAIKSGKRFAVDLRVRVGHLDISDGTVY